MPQVSISNWKSVSSHPKLYAFPTIFYQNYENSMKMHKNHQMGERKTLESLLHPKLYAHHRGNEVKDLSCPLFNFLCQNLVTSLTINVWNLIAWR